MDWLTFIFCVLIWVLFVSKSQSKLLNSTSSLSHSHNSQSSCEEGQPVVPPDECNTCTCFAGVKYCTNISCPERECVNGEEIPPPDACNKCICRRGKVTCSNVICIPAPNCAEKQLYPPPNNCNACMCLNGFIMCTSNYCYEENWAGFDPRATTNMPDKKECIEGSSLPGPNKCIECFCQNGRKRCKYVCSPTMQLQNRFAEPECFPGQIIPPPDDCNSCICFEGEIHCTYMPCDTDMHRGRECREDQPVFRPDECNECYCFEGRLECSDLVCIRGSRCVPGQVIPKPDSCNACKCVEGHILCTNYQCPKLDPRNGLTTGSATTNVKPLDDCQDGDVLPSLPPPHDCNTCYCIENTIMCTVNTCVDSAPEIKGRLKEQNEQINLQNFDKQISLEPFIDILYKKNIKLPTKVIHTHAYNGFHQEIKVHANHLPKDATSLLKVLATSLDNSALASISQRLLTFHDTLSNSRDLKMPFNQKVVQNNLLGEGNVITTQSSKLITSGSQSNETIFVIPSTESFESENLQSILPLKNNHETIWKTVSAPATIVYHNNQPINPRNSLEENMNVHHDDRPPPILNSIQQSDLIRNPSKFSRPGRPHDLPKPTRDTQYNPILNPKQININDGKNNYAPLYQENDKFKPVPSGFLAKRDELPHIPPHNPIKKPLQSPFVPNQSKYYPNRFKSQEFQIVPTQNQPSQIVLTTFNNKAIQNPSLFPNTPNHPTVLANQYKPLEFGMKPSQGNPYNNIGNQNDQQFKQLPPQDGVNTEHSQNQPTLSQFVPNPSIYYKSEYEGPKINDIPHSKPSDTLTEHHSQPQTFSELDHEAIIPKVRNKTKRYNTTHSHYENHTTITYISDFDPNDPTHLKIAGHDLNQDHNAPHTNEYEHYSPVQESQEIDLTRSKVNYYLNLPNIQPQLKLTHYNQSLTSPTNSAEYPTHQDPRPPKLDHELPSPKLEAPQNNHLLGMLDERGSADGFQYPSNSAEDPKNKLNTSPHFAPDTSHFDPAPPKDDLDITLHSQIGPAQNQHKLGILDNHGGEDEYHFAYNANQNPAQLKPRYELPNFPFDPSKQHKTGTLDERGTAVGFQYPSNSAEDPIHSRGNLHIPQKPQLNPKRIQDLPGMFDERGSADGFQYPSNSAPSQPKGKIQKSPNTLLRPSQAQRLPGIIEDLGSAGGFRYPSNSAEKSSYPNDSPHNPSHPKENLDKPSLLLFGPTQNQYLPSFQYPSHSAENPSHPKQNIQKQPNSPYGPTPNQHLTGMFDERGSADGFQYPSHSAEDPPHLKQKNKKQPNSLYGPPPNQHLTGMFDERGSADGFQYPSHSAEIPLKTKDNKHHPKQSQFQPSPNQYNKNMHKQPKSPFGPMQDKHLPGMFHERGSADGFQYPSNSAERPLQTKNLKIPSQSQFHPSHNQYKENNPTQNHHTEKHAEHGSVNGFQYPSHSAENTAYPKHNLHNRPQSQLLPANNQYKGYIQKQPNASFGYTQNQYLPVAFDKKQTISAEDPTHTKSTSQIFPHPQLGPTQNHQKDNTLKPSDFPFGPILINSLPEVLDERGSADGFQYPSFSAEETTHNKNNSDITLDSEVLSKIFNDNNDNPLRPLIHLDHDQYKPTSFDNLLNEVHNIPWSFPDDNKADSNIITSTLQSRFEPDRDQYKPSTFDNMLNGVHDIPWSVPEDHEKVLNTITSAPKPRIKSERNQYKPSSFDNLINENHQIPLPIANQDNDALGTDTEITTPRTDFNPKKDQREPSMIENPSLSPIFNQKNLSHEDDDEQQIEKDSNTELTNFDGTQFKPHPEIKPDSDPSNLPINDKIPDYFDQLYPLLNAVKKLSKPPFYDSALSVDQLYLFPFLFPGIAKMLNYEPEKDQDDALSVEDHEFQSISPLLKFKSKLKLLPDSGNGIVNWLKRKLLKFVPLKYNVTVNPNDIDMTKIFHLLKKLTAPKIKDNAILQNIPFSGFDPEIIENIMNDFQEVNFTTTPSPRIDTTHNYGNRFKTIQTESDENGSQAPQTKYPDVHIILHQPSDEGDLVLPPYMETEGAANLATDMSYEDFADPLFSKVFDHRFRHRPKDQKDECGDGTHWISNCHGCSCYFGKPKCYKMHDCVLRTFGEPMACKPYSHFKMGCYSCECNGDGVAECDAMDCFSISSGKIEGTTEKPLPVFNKFFDSKETDEILQYYNFNKKLPKDCPTPDLQAQYPTCERGTSWVSSCHKCECNENGQHECIKIDDCKLDFDSYGKPGRCKPNSKFYPKTNSLPCAECSCNDEGHPYCPTVDYKKHRVLVKKDDVEEGVLDVNRL